MKKYLFFILVLILTACSHTSVPTQYTDNNQLPAIYPDYAGVTIPVNIAPLNFSVTAEAGDYQLCIRGTDSEINVHSEDNSFDIPLKTWRKLLSENAGQEISMRIAKKTTEGWVAYREMHVKVSAESIDPYLAYRLIPPYEQWNRMGIYQRNLESFEESPIFENKMTDFGFVNCHTFNQRSPEKMVFHSRAKAPGTAYIHDGIIEKINTRTEETKGNMQYTYNFVVKQVHFVGKKESNPAVAMKAQAAPATAPVAPGALPFPPVRHTDFPAPPIAPERSAGFPRLER